MTAEPDLSPKDGADNPPPEQTPNDPYSKMTPEELAEYINNQREPGVPPLGSPGMLTREELAELIRQQRKAKEAMRNIIRRRLPKTALDLARERFIEVRREAGWIWEFDSNEQTTYWINPDNRDIFFCIRVDRPEIEMRFSRDLYEQLKEDGSAEELLRLIREDDIQRQVGNP